MNVRWMCDAREQVRGKWLPSHRFTCAFECRASTVHTFINAHVMDIRRLLKHCYGFVLALSDGSLSRALCIFISAYLSLLFVIVRYANIPGGSTENSQTEIILTLLLLFSTVLWRWTSQQIHNTITWNDSGRQMVWYSLVHALFCYYCCCFHSHIVWEWLKMNAFNI